MRWFKFPADAVNDPLLQRLPADKFKTWINLLCITSTHNGALPSLTDLAFLLRPMGEDKIAAMIEDFCEKGLLDQIEAPGGSTQYAPHDWASRQYVDGTAADRAKRYRDRNRGVTRDGCVTNGGVTRLDKNKEKKTRDSVTPARGYYAKADSDELAAWDEHNRRITGKSLPRDRHGGWYVDSQFPPMHAISGRTA